MTKIKTGVYIHIPFCKKRCYYCDFITFSNKEHEFESYKNALLAEIRSSNLADCEIQTIFIGGGTPTVLPANMLCEIINEVCKYSLKKDAEITVEANPGTLSLSYLKALYNVGVNRLSIGLQAWQDNYLKDIGRIHNSQMFVQNFNSAVLTGFNNINVDLMFSLPGLTLQDWENTLINVVNMSPAHISAYSLIIEEGTVFGKLYDKGLIKQPEDKLDREMYEITKSILESNGYMQYEISNFAKPDFYSKHNVDCWNRKNYIGFGLNAHSLFEGIRFYNTKDLKHYIKNSKNSGLIRKSVIVLNKKECMEEFMFLGLRLINGIDVIDFKTQFGVDIFEVYTKEINKLIKEGMLIFFENRLYLSSKGLDLANYVFEKFIFNK